MVAGDSFDDEGEEADEEGIDNESAKCLDEDLATNNDAAQIYVPFLLLFMFLSFCGRQGCVPCSYVFLNCDKKIKPT